MTADQIDPDLADDSLHAIPQVDVIDVWGERKTGGADLVVIIASPAVSDLKTRKRVVAKIRNYLGYLPSEEFESKCGRADPSNTRIIVEIVAECDPALVDFLHECSGWVSDNRATLEVKRKANKPVDPTPGSAPRSSGSQSQD